MSKNIFEELGIEEEIRDATAGFIMEGCSDEKVLLAVNLAEEVARYEQVNVEEVYRKYWNCFDIMGTSYRLQNLLSDFTGETIPQIRKRYGLE